VLDSAKGDTFLNLRHQALLNFTRPGEEILLVTGRHTDLTGTAIPPSSQTRDLSLTSLW
jgi:hypothetical protein